MLKKLLRYSQQLLKKCLPLFYRIDKLYRRHDLCIKILTPVPTEGDQAFWKWHQREAILLGKPFRFQWGAFIYKVPQLNLLDYYRLESLINQGHIIEHFLLCLIPDNNLGRRLSRKQHQKLRDKYLSYTGLLGVISEYILYLTAVKKKLGKLNYQGVMPRAQAPASTLLPKLKTSPWLQDFWDLGFLQ